MTAGRLPPIYVDASWRNTTPVDIHRDAGRVGIGFDLADGSVVRIALDGLSLKQLVASIFESLLDFKPQKT